LSGDLEEFEGENRGGKHIAEFFDYFPDIEDSAKQFTLDQCSRKSAVFTAIDLANFIDKEFYSTTKTVKGEILRPTSFFRNSKRFYFRFQRSSDPQCLLLSLGPHPLGSPLQG
jgi:hypothetical protein